MNPVIREAAKEAADLGYTNLLFRSGDGGMVTLLKEHPDGIAVSMKLELVGDKVHATLTHMPTNTMMLQMSTPSFSFPHRSFAALEEPLFMAGRAYALARHEANLMQRNARTAGQSRPDKG